MGAGNNNNNNNDNMRGVQKWYEASDMLTGW